MAVDELDGFVIGKAAVVAAVLALAGAGVGAVVAIGNPPGIALGVPITSMRISF